MKATRDIEAYTAQYNQHTFEDIQAKYRKKMLLENYHKIKPETVLEIGCGMDPFFTENISYEKYVVVEPSLQFYENAIEMKGSKSNINIINDFFENRTKELQKYDFDLIIISGLLHDLVNPIDFLNKLKHIISQSTIVHINVPNSNSFHRLLALESDLISSAKEFSTSNICLQQRNVFDMQSLSKMVNDVGFDIIEEGGYFVKPFAHHQMSELLKYKIIDEKILEGFYNMSKYMPDLSSEIFINMKLK